jgi:peptidase E
MEYVINVKINLEYINMEDDCMKLFLTSVANNCLEYIESFKEIINSQTNLVILPFSYSKNYINSSEDIINHFDRDINNKDSIYWKTAAPFINAGINPDKISVVNQYNDPIELIKHKITRDNTVVYLPGGYPENIVENIYKYDLIEAIKSCKIIVGESAGSMCVFNDFFVYNDYYDYEEYDEYKGLNLLNKATLIPHLNREDYEMLYACGRFKKNHRTTKVYCIEDGGYMIYNNNKLVKTHKTYIYKKRSNKYKLI